MGMFPKKKRLRNERLKFSEEIEESRLFVRNLKVVCYYGAYRLYLQGVGGNSREFWKKKKNRRFELYLETFRPFEEYVTEVLNERTKKKKHFFL